ncbi:MAG: aldehyde ferredoxin oxidoreductase family protein [Deltaproteobacteria bacterium]|nr:aldehyde ferredoxin oxidoreductase family protein [Deltaproteobacteria bacterium]
MATMTGKLLRIDLTTGTHRDEEIPASYTREYLSARGLGVRYLYDELRPGVDPLSPENKLIFGIGLLGGTKLQGFSKWAVMTKSPLTGTIMRSITGGNFGVWMKSAGYDLIVLEGRAPDACHVHIDEHGVHFLDARDLLGQDPRAVQARLKERHGPQTESACIGLAGERGVLYAVIASGERTASRGGVGTVMGSKNLKAISIHAPRAKVVAHDAARFDELARAQIEMLKENPRRKTMNTVGTPYITTVLAQKGILPMRNFREGSIENLQEISGNAFLETKEATSGCHACMTRCGGMRSVVRGPYAGTRIDGPEYESVFSLGPGLGIADRQFIVDANAACDYYGLDTISAGVCASFAFELYERGVLGPSDTGGVELTWGNQEAALWLLERIAKRDGVGDLLSQGVKRAGQRCGGDAPDIAMHVKGLELPGYEPRSVKGYALSMATSNIGGSHMYGRPRDELAGKVDPHTETGKGEAIAQVQKEQALEDSLIACSFGNSGLSLKDYAAFLVAATGIEALGSPEELRTIGERVVCLERCFNVREGFGRADDTLPRRMFREPLLDAGPSTGQRVSSLDTLLDEYYRALGYDAEGVPRLETLEALGLGALTRDLTPAE